MNVYSYNDFINIQRPCLIVMALLTTYLLCRSYALLSELKYLVHAIQCQG